MLMIQHCNTSNYQHTVILGLPYCNNLMQSALKLLLTPLHVTADSHNITIHCCYSTSVIGFKTYVTFTTVAKCGIVHK